MRQNQPIILLQSVVYDQLHQSSLGVPSPKCATKVGSNDTSGAPNKRECGCPSWKFVSFGPLLLCD